MMFLAVTCTNEDIAVTGRQFGSGAIVRSVIERQRNMYLWGVVICGMLLSLRGWAQDASALASVFPLPTRPIASLAALVQPRQVYSYQRLLADAHQLADTYPGLIEVSDIGHSAFGRRIIAIRLGKGSAEVTLNGAHHGREWITSALLMAMLDRYALAYYRGELVDGYDVYALLNRVSLWVVPMVNPDGVSLVQCGAASAPQPQRVIALNKGSRDFTAWKANGRGVDLNRQYPAHWESIAMPAPAPAAENYRGAAPLSEPEAQAMVAFTQAHQFALHLALHTAGEVIYWHFYQQGDLYTRSARIARRLQTLTSYKMLPPHDYESGGGYKDWVVQAFGMPAFTVEVGQHPRRGPVPLTEFSHIWVGVQSLGLFLAQEAVTPCKSDSSVRGYLDLRLVAVGDSPAFLQDDLRRRVQQGEGNTAEIIRAGESRSCWRYPEATCYRVVIEGETLTTLNDRQAAEDALAQAVTAKHAAGGFVVTQTRALVCTQGAGIAHQLTITPQGTMDVDGTTTALPERPCERQGRLYVPLALFSALGATTTFDADRQAVIVSYGNTRLILLYGSALAMRNDIPLRLDAPVFTSARDIAMVPLRSVAQALNSCVTVEPATGAVSIRWYTAQSAPAADARN